MIADARLRTPSRPSWVREVKRRWLRYCVAIQSALLVAFLLPSPPSYAVTVPSGLLSPGTYNVNDWENGNPPIGGTLDVSNSGYYTQTLNVQAGPIEMWLYQPLGGEDIYMQQLYLAGLYFTSNGQALPNGPPPVLYRPYTAPGVLSPNQTWYFSQLGQTCTQPSIQCLLYSTSGGVTIEDVSSYGTPENYLTRSGQSLVVQEVDSTLTLGGNGSGTIQVVQFETPGDPTKFQAQYISLGPITVLGSQYVINATVTLGGLE